MFDTFRAKRARPTTDRPLAGWRRRFVKLQIGSKTRMRLYEKLGKFVANGVPLIRALDELHAHASKDGAKPQAPLALAIREWRRAMLNGQSFANALRGWAPLSELSVLQAGEVAGRFDRAVEDVLFLHTAGKRIRGALSGLLYPVVLIATTCLYLYIFGAKVVPAFAAILPVSQWQGAGQSMAGLAQFVEHGLLPTVLAVLLASGLAAATLPGWTGKARRVADRFPPWSLYRLVLGSGFMVSLSALIHAGVSVPEALQLLGRNASPWYRERLHATRREVLNGARNIGDALNKTGFDFPSVESVMDIRAYASLEGFEDMLSQLARQWTDDSVRLIQEQMDLLRNAAIIFMAFVFMWIVTGMFALQQQISSAAN
ncbi:MAG: type II secretion system F family protein [Paludibacterium sp.]|uniref:type II secretion system F family protein n=1 Tax=Paludibacterium sp. TaxID=1917523 RepID=UPI0025ED25B4|nr:type II secretion system F family protein [Paludibacterium sp.]MBV8046445.1 type II secretion system F family protein [Paludibacterium sp.]